MSVVKYGGTYTRLNREFTAGFEHPLGNGCHRMSRMPICFFMYIEYYQ
jgi:hypothetical protein